MPHSLPLAHRNAPERDEQGRNSYRDVEYPRWGLIVEFDGRAAHPPDQAFRDLRRDNEVTMSGRNVLHYGWRDVIGVRCFVAAQVGLALQQRGWPGPIGRCGPTCPIPPPVESA